MNTDAELLREFVEQGSEAAFAEIVRRNMNLVYAAALRLANGNAALAEDVTQSVFTDLAQKAVELRGHSTLAGWLHTSTYYAVAKAIRSEQRRQRREQEASIMNDITITDNDDCWMQLRPALDEAVNRLGEGERDAVLLRFFQEKSHREIGAILGVSEDAARMRIERALEKMRVQFARRGVMATAALLTTTLGARAADTVAPAALAAQVVQQSLLDVGAAKSGGALAKVFGSKTPLVIAGVLAAAAAVAAAAIYSPAPANPPAPVAAVAPKAKPAAVVAKIASEPGPSVDATQVLAASTVVATVTTVASSEAAATSDSVSTVQDLVASADQPTPSNPETSSTATADSNDPSTAEPQKSESTPVAVRASSNGPVGIAQWGISGWAEDTRETPYDNTPTLINTNGVLRGKTVISITSGIGFKMALCSDGTLARWGSYRRLNSPPKGSNEPVLVNPGVQMAPKKVITLAAGGRQAWALCSDGTVYQLGDGVPLGQPPGSNDLKAPSIPRLFQSNVLYGRKVVALACGEFHCLALCSDGALICWGRFFDDSDYRASKLDQTVEKEYWTFCAPQVVNKDGLLKGKKITAISAGDCHSLVLCSDGTLAEWGEGVYADASTYVKSQQERQDAVSSKNRPRIDAAYRVYTDARLKMTPVPVNTNGVLAGKTITAIATSDQLDLVLCSDGTMAEWGVNFGPNGKVRPVQDPVLVDTSGVLNGKKVTAVTAMAPSGFFGFLALCSDGTLAAWGSGSKGQLGNGKGGDNFYAQEPVRVDESGVLKGKTILALAPNAVLFK